MRGRLGEGGGDIFKTELAIKQLPSFIQRSSTNRTMVMIDVR